MRNSNGITLIALIITIVVLLILAVVAIRAVTGDGILQHAKNAQTEYQTAQGEENTTLQGYLDKIEENAPGGNGGSQGGDTVFPKATVGTEVNENSTINGEMYSSTNPVIPKGFKAINTDTSKWDDTNGPQVQKGLVISDGTSEFVWIPVEDLDSFARVQAEGSTDYRGVLYNWRDTTGKTEYDWPENSAGYKEPDIVAGTDRTRLDAVNLSYFNITESLDSDTDVDTDDLKILFQRSFNKMVKSVSKYKGFYVGRYETSLNGNIAQSKSGETPMNNINWYVMYNNSRTYSSNNSSLGVESEMIWGCQWDAMLKFILTTDDASHITATTNDKSANIYALEGNITEWTQEAQGTFGRAFRGDNAPINRDGSDFDQTAAYSNVSSRLSLYVK